MAASGDELDDRLNEVGFVIRLAEEACSFRQATLLDDSTARSDDQFDGRPAIADVVRELDPVHGAGHLHICEHQMDVRARLEDFDGFVCAARLDRFKAGAFNEIHSRQSYDFIIFDDQDDGLDFGHVELTDSQQRGDDRRVARRARLLRTAASQSIGDPPGHPDRANLVMYYRNDRTGAAIRDGDVAAKLSSECLHNASPETRLRRLFGSWHPYAVITDRERPLSISRSVGDYD